jgi:hypothetical protein
MLFSVPAPGLISDQSVHQSHSPSKGKVLSHPYAYDEAKLVFTEIVDHLANDSSPKISPQVDFPSG